MRGKVTGMLNMYNALGITPAYAGKSTHSCVRISLCWDHPRVCGEKSTRHILMAHATGSPPRMRGKAEPEAAPRPALRITPAYAGKSPWPCTAGQRHEDHPRVCGEKSVRRSDSRVSQGSPPRMRGKEAEWAALWQHYRITPAYAGKSSARAVDEKPSGDHPRVCGEKRVNHP